MFKSKYSWKPTKYMEWSTKLPTVPKRGRFKLLYAWIYPACFHSDLKEKTVPIARHSGELIYYNQMEEPKH